jgi:hypothetical protein
LKKQFAGGTDTSWKQQLPKTDDPTSEKISAKKTFLKFFIKILQI